MKLKYLLLILGLIVFTLLTRLVHIDGLPQFNALLATAAFMGFVIRDTKWAVAAALLMMIVSDMILGSYDILTTLVNYAAIVAIVLMTRYMATYSLRNAFMSSLVAPVLFFLISNLGVFLFSVPQLYPHTATGLIDCYMMAVPFARGTVLGTLLYGAIYYVAYHKAIANALVPNRQKS